ncbi:SDR family NAD(P)-dependent oxidoreductase [Reinekea blandensis]|uniref:Putative oxidoreductase n=1 Tax=Reinekea blandensis MED297 TaxID=314283 RepID=A4BIH9_9GAMM|nr:SDR family NAD(P)-dependent oxidoreductase [Reinekea blandensis]EAR08058.1 putative oxidoreductase [Reinekea sp. MED297] [Reinekea blandensis MED297]
MLDTLKDYSVVYSFDRSGYERHARHFSELNATSLAGKHFLVTGGTRGIGQAITEGLLAYGAEVTVSARSDRDYRANFGHHSRVRFLPLDLADFNAVMAADLSVYDGVVLNAGGMPDKLQVVEDRFDVIFASQVVGHFLLVRRLITEGSLKPLSPVHWVASGGMYLQKLNLSDLSWQRTDYDKVKSYANAKRAQVILNELMAQRFKNFTFSCSHPGWVATQALADALPGFTKKLGHRLRTPEQGADTILWCLEQGRKLKSGRFWFDRRARKTHPFFWTREREADRLALLELLEAEWHAHQSIPSKVATSVN